ncbi:MAG: JAB domain-containing protein [Bacteroidota bacterium]
MKATDMLNFKVAEIKVSYRYRVKPTECPKISSSRDCYQLLKSLWSNKLEYCEEFYVLLLNHANKVLGVAKISEGGISVTVVDPKKVFQTVLKANASAVILAHNHPSGNIQPSEADNKLTVKLKNAGMLLDVNVLDHLIITAESYYSYADNGCI